MLPPKMKESTTKTSAPILSVPAVAPLPAFSSLRSRNLRILYGADDAASDPSRDKSPKGSVDAKILPLVDLINRHPEYVTLSSCSGRVALFDPGVEDDDDDDCERRRHDDESNDPEDDNEAPNDHRRPHDDLHLARADNRASGKGRGKWLFVTHDILFDLGPQILRSLAEAASAGRRTLSLKHEPPLLHVAASSLSSGKRMLRLLKSKCAMRESGLVVTDARVTVEVRSAGGSLAVPVFVNGAAEIRPEREYVLELARVMNERMAWNERMLERMYRVLERELFDVSGNGQETLCGNESDEDYRVSLCPLPSLNLWKTAAVALPSWGDSRDEKKVNGMDWDVLAFGGQGIGPSDSQKEHAVKNTTCQRMDAVFRLKRRGGVWSHKWDAVQLDETIVNDGNTVLNRLEWNTNAGTFRANVVKSLGRREGHAACVLPRLPSALPSSSTGASGDAVVIFGGRAGGPLSPTNDLLLFSLHHCHRSDDQDDGVAYGTMCIPTDVRGIPPQARYGHSMTPLQACDHCNKHLERGEALALVAGGMGVSDIDGSVQVVLSSVHILSRCRNDDSESYHFLWERIEDMQLPRSYLSAIRVPLECSNGVLVFGGINKADDPFDDELGNSGPCFEVLGCGNNSWVSDSSSNECDLPLVIGGFGVSLDNSPSSTAFLVVGGAKPCTLARSHEENDTLGVFRWKSNGKGSVEGPVKANTTILQNEGNVWDLGVCVHHCLVQLPTSTDTSDESTTISSVLSVGGGVPSFSFGQSFSKSFLINVKRSNSSDEDTPHRSRYSLNHSIRPKIQEESQSSISSPPEADVVYVSSSNAKKVKVELESLGYLDKRFKMVKVVVGDTNLIALPITDSCLSYLKQERSGCASNDGSGDQESAYTFEGLILKTGRESVPLSSSSLGKLKQRR
ncbi:hypothetical protein ACHAWX_002582 [Stephanocyclus meneghinianus]